MITTKTAKAAPFVGMRGTTSGFAATVVRVCDWSRHDGDPKNVMVEVRVPGGVACIDFAEFEPTSGAR